jgi:serine/threonine-protein kinase
VDAVGNVFVTDFATGEIVQLPSGSDTSKVVGTVNPSSPTGVATDSVGNVYVSANNYHDTNIYGFVVKLSSSAFASGSSALIPMPFTGLDRAEGVAVDSASNVYVPSPNQDRVVKLQAGSDALTVLPIDGGPGGVALDSAGNLYVQVGSGSDAQILRLSAAA